MKLLFNFGSVMSAMVISQAPGSGSTTLSLSPKTNMNGSFYGNTSGTFANSNSGSFHGYGSVGDDAAQQMMTKQLSKVSFAPETWDREEESYDEDGNPKRKSTLKLKNKYNMRGKKEQQGTVEKQNTDNTMLRTRENSMANIRQKTRAKSAYIGNNGSNGPFNLKPMPPVPTLWPNSPEDSGGEDLADLGDIAEEDEEEYDTDDGFVDDQEAKTGFNAHHVTQSFQSENRKNKTNLTPAPASTIMEKKPSMKKQQSIQKQMSKKKSLQKAIAKPNVKESGSIGALGAQRKSQGNLGDHGVFSPFSHKFKRKSDPGDDIPYL